MQRTATEHGKKVQLELGGKNPAVVLDDADLDLAAEHVARGAFLSAGQKCTATSRVIVQQDVLAAFQERLAALAKSWKLGRSTRIGYSGRAACVRRSARDGQRVPRRRPSGRRARPGRRRTSRRAGRGLLHSANRARRREPRERVVREEIFGPVAAVLPASSYADAVRLANDTRYGLSASVFTNDLTRALRFSDDIHAGVVKINQESAGVEFHVPFGGMQESSSGSREQGKAAREFFTQWKTVYLDRQP